MAKNSSAPADVMERRLKPVYDNLDMGNHKKAVQECEKLLKKHPDIVCARALKALALIRLGKLEEARPLLGEVVSAEPSDESSLSALTYCFRDLGEPERVVGVYESAVRQLPQSEELLTHLFMACVRVQDYRKQQQTALQLNKVAPKNPYYFWALMSSIMQGVADKEKGAKMFFPLTWRMIEKFLKEGEFEADAEVELCLLLLELQERWTFLLDWLLGRIGAAWLKESVRKTRLCDIYSRLADWPNVWKYANELLSADNEEEASDDWLIYQQLMTASLKLQTEDSTYLENAIALIKSKLETAKQLDAARPSRLPFLAHLYISILNNALNDDIVSLLVDYFERFGTKGCCILDLSPLLPKMSPEVRAAFLTHIPRLVASAQCLDVSRYNLYLLTARQLEWSLREDWALQMGEDFFQSLLTECLAIPEEIMVTAAFCSVIVPVAWWLYRQSTQQKYLILALAMFQLRVSQTAAGDFRPRLAAQKFYAELGAAEVMSRAIDTLGLKYTQWDSLGYLSSQPLNAWFEGKDRITWAKNMLKFYEHAHRDIGEVLIGAYRGGSFVKIVEFCSFRTKLSQSAYRLEPALEHAYHGLLWSEPESYNEILASDTFHWLLAVDVSDLVDNRDLQPMEICLRVEQLGEEVLSELQRTTFAELKQCLRFKQLLCQLWYSFDSYGSNASGDEGIQDPWQAFQELNAFCQRCKSQEKYEDKTKLRDDVRAPPLTHLDAFMHGSYFPVISSVCETLLKSLAVKSSCSPSSQQNGANETHVVNGTEAPSDSAPELQTALRNMVSGHLWQNAEDGPHRQLIHLSFCLQTVGIALICCYFSRQFQSNSRRGKKKKAHATAAQTTLEELLYVSSACSSFLETVESLVEDLNMVLDSVVLETQFSQLALSENPVYAQLAQDVGEVQKTLAASYKHSTQALIELRGRLSKLAGLLSS